MYIENATEKDHNVCRNVKSKHLEEFQQQCQKAFKTLQENRVQSSNSLWGLASLIDVEKLPSRSRVDLRYFKEKSNNKNIVMSDYMSTSDTSSETGEIMGEFQY